MKDIKVSYKKSGEQVTCEWIQIPEVGDNTDEAKARKVLEEEYSGYNITDIYILQ